MTQRLPFDPGRMSAGRGADQSSAGNDGPGSGAGDGKAMSVAGLAALIEGSIARGVPKRVRVHGEVSGARERTHLYLTLREPGAGERSGVPTIQGVVFASVLRKLRTPLRDGDEVIASGRVEYYAPGGRVSLIIDSARHVGEGARDRALRELVDELRGLGWLDPGRKRALPGVPGRVAVITSRSSAALQDVLDTARRRFPGIAIALVDARVQGEDAAGEITRAIRSVSVRAETQKFDAMILTRGGGSAEDLWCFNDREMARAIVECSIPVVAAIGHETDTTVAELVADHRAATPTQAAMALFPDRDALGRQLDSQRSRLDRAVVDSVESGADRLRAALVRLERVSPAAILSNERASLAGRLERVERAVRARMRAEDSRVHAAVGRLEGVSPMSVLARGYSVVEDAKGRIVRSGDQARAARRVRVRFAEGEARGRIVGEDTQLDLFG